MQYMQPSGSKTEFLNRLDLDPYTIFDALRTDGPVHWITPLNLWYVVDHDVAHRILRDTEAFVTGTPESLLYDTFGTHMLTVDGPDQVRYRSAFRQAFAKRHVRETLADDIQASIDTLIDSFVEDGSTDLRQSFASRLPILTMLNLFGLSPTLERKFRNWYNSFEAALANFEWKDDVRKRALTCVDDFHHFMQSEIDRVRCTNGTGLLANVVNAKCGPALSDDEIRRNALIILFGGISTVEALILNTTYAVLLFNHVRSMLVHDFDRLPDIIDESVRWQSPVQSATRHAACDLDIAGQRMKKGDTVNCMLGAANRDPKIFSHPAEFRPGRPNIKRHPGFATGPHVCLGNHLARLETEIAIKRLLQRLPGLRLSTPDDVVIRGYEFHQPGRLDIAWQR